MALTVGEGKRFERRVDVPRSAKFAHDFTLPRGGLRGRVRTKAGAPVAKAKVELTVCGGITLWSATTSISWWEVTDADGRFAFATLEPGLYAASVNSGSVEGAGPIAASCKRDVVVTESAQEELDIELAPGTVVRGTVRTTLDAPTNFAHVFVLDEHGEAVNPLNGATADKTGAFTLPALAPGRYTVVAARGDAWSEPVALELRPDVAAADIALVLRPAAKIEVEGAELEAAWIDVRDAAGNGFAGLVDRNTFSESMGRVRSTTSRSYFVPAGNYTIRALGRDGIVARARVSTVEGETVRIPLAR